jgi:hypothetical protein
MVAFGVVAVHYNFSQLRSQAYTMKILLAASALALAGQAHALTAYSLGGDTGFGAQTDVVTFDAPNTTGVTETDSGPMGSVGLHILTSGTAAAPAGDATVYQALQPGGSAKFSFTGYGDVGQASVYVGSIDAYNTFKVSTSTGNYYYTGLNFLNHDGDQSSLATNRNIYFFAAPGQNINSITFGSSGIAFEYDDIAVAPYQAGQGVPPPGAEILSPTAVPELGTWALMTIGMFGMGAAFRSHRRKTLTINA